MRTRHPAPMQEPILLGDPELAQVCARALIHEDVTERFTHGLHTYPAGLHPLAARDLMEALPGASVYDPFCGGGTVLIEGRLAGRVTYGRDVSPVALMVARARTATPPAEVITAFRSAGRRMAAEARAATESPSRTKLDAVHSWYSRHALLELESLRKAMVRAPNDIQPLLAMCFSSILVKVSWRRSDTSPQRVKHKRPPGTTAVLFHKKVRELGRALDQLREAFATGALTKTYRFRARRQVSWDHNTCDRPIAHDRRRKRRMVVQRGPNTPHRGRWHPATTHFRRIGPHLWEATMHTGVMHQIRVHAAFVGLVLAGDPVYGGGEPLEEAIEGAPFLLHHVGFRGRFATAPVPLPRWASTP